jgi:hypothetical protein
MKTILTKPNYWNSIPEAVKSMWQNIANGSSTIVCTHRPDIRIRDHRGSDKVRRCSTGGKWGKSADIVSLSIESLLAAGYVWRTYVPRSERLANEREMIYSDDTH